MIREADVVHVPFAGLQFLQIQPVQSEREAKKFERRGAACEWRSKPVLSQVCPNSGSLALQVGERPHRTPPSHVHRVEVTADDLRAIYSVERVKQWRELGQSVSAIDACVEMDVHHPHRTVWCDHSGCERN